MRKAALVTAIAFFALGLLVSAQVNSQETPDKQQMPPEMAKMLEAWQKANAKGPQHERFKDWVGTWDAETTMFMPGMEPMVSQGSAEFRLILDGRYIEQVFKCPMMGNVYEGRGFEGYDNVKKKYVSVWMGNDSTGISMMEGTMDETGKVATYHGKADDPMTGMQKTVKAIAREIDKNSLDFTMFEGYPDGSEVKVMEIVYKRRK